MNNRIDEIQREIDELIGMLAEAGGGDSESAEGLDFYSKIGYLALKIQDDELEEDQFGKLENWLKSDPEVLRYYIEFQNLNALLYTYYNKDRLQQLFQKIRESLAVTYQ